MLKTFEPALFQHVEEPVRKMMAIEFPWNRPDVAHPELSTPESWWRHVELLLTEGYEVIGVPGGRAKTLARAVHDRFIDPRFWHVFPESISVLASLEAKGWRHIILSNHVPELPSLVRELGLSTLIEAIITSASSGYEKPHPRSFEIARAAAGDVEQIWMVGDNARVDVEGAEENEIPAILIGNDGGGRDRVRHHATSLEGIVRLLSG